MERLIFSPRKTEIFSGKRDFLKGRRNFRMETVRFLLGDRTGAERTGPGGTFLEIPGNLTGPESDFDMKVSRKAGCVLTSDEVHFVSLAPNFTVLFSNLLKPPLDWKTKQLNGPGNYRELRETGSRSRIGSRIESQKRKVLKKKNRIVYLTNKEA